MSCAQRQAIVNVKRISSLRRGRLAALAIVLVVGAAWCAAPAAAAPGVTDDAVTFGQSAPLSGPGERSGRQYRAGILAAFHERNAEGGVNGRQLKLVTRDDGYEPSPAAANARQFIEENKVFAVIGSVGTPTVKRMLPIFRSAMMPFVGPFTGAEFLRDAERNPNVVNLHAGYREEVQLSVNHLYDHEGARRFGIIYQDDAFGRSILKHFEAALTALDLPILAKSAYSRNTHAVHGAAFVMAKADLDVVMLAATSGVAIEIVNTATSLGHGYIMAALSFISMERLRVSLKDQDALVLVTKVTPNFADDNVALVKSFRAALAAYKEVDPASKEREADSLSLRGYILGRFIISVLERMPDELTREAFLEAALAPTPIHIEDWEIVFQEGTNVGSHYVRFEHLTGSERTRETGE